MRVTGMGSRPHPSTPCETSMPYRLAYCQACSAHSTSGQHGRDRIVVSTSRCGRDNPGSNPGHGRGCVVSITASLLVFTSK